MGARVGKGWCAVLGMVDEEDGWDGSLKDCTWFLGQGGLVMWRVIVVSGVVFHGRGISNGSLYLGGGNNIHGLMEDSMGVFSDLEPLACASELATMIQAKNVPSRYFTKSL